jgi:hypothetical protein
VASFTLSIAFVASSLARVGLCTFVTLVWQGRPIVAHAYDSISEKVSVALKAFDDMIHNAADIDSGASRVAALFVGGSA